MAAVRPATPSDLGQITRLAAAAPEVPHWQPRVYEQFLSPSDPAKHLFIAERDGTITGFAATQIMGQVCELESVVVGASFRRSGIGSALLATVIEWARKQGGARLQLEVRAGNAKAIAFYERFGCLHEGLRRRYYCDPTEDALLMSLPLASPDPRP